MDWLHYKKIYFLLSGIAIAVGIFSLLTWGLKLGVDFRGGSILEYKFEKEISTEKLIEEIKNEGFDNVVIQTTGANTYLIKLPPLQKEDKEKIASATAKLISSTEEPDQATVSAANI